MGHISISEQEYQSIVNDQDGEKPMKTKPIPPHIDPIPVDDEVHISTMERILYGGAGVVDEVAEALEDGKITLSEGMSIAYAIVAALAGVIK